MGVDTGGLPCENRASTIGPFCPARLCQKEKTHAKAPASGRFPSCRGQVAERVGFEPTIRGYRIHTFQACAFDHSATSL